MKNQLIQTMMMKTMTTMVMMKEMNMVAITVAMVKTNQEKVTTSKEDFTRTFHILQEVEMVVLREDQTRTMKCTSNRGCRGDAYEKEEICT